MLVASIALINMLTALKNVTLGLCLWNLGLFLVVVAYEDFRMVLPHEPKPIWNSTISDRLRKDLLENYDKFSRPALHFDTTTVKLRLTVLHADVIETKSSFLVYGYTSLIWTDEKLQWKESEYDNITLLHFGSHEIWQPDIFLYNSATPQAINNDGHTHAIVYSNGEVLWIPPGQFTVLCDINLRYWPFDTQTCGLMFASWTAHGNQINLTSYENENVDIDNVISSYQWQIISSTIERNEKYYTCCEEPYPFINFNITVARNSPSYKAVVIIPAFAVILLILTSFWLPPQAGEKVILQGVTAIIISLFLLYFTQNLPAMGSNTPLIVLFYSHSLYVVCASLISTIAVIWLSRTPHTLYLPWTIKQVLMGKLGNGLFFGNYINQTNINTHRVRAQEMRDYHCNSDMDDRDHQITDDDHRIIDTINTNTNQGNQQDWILLAAAINRGSFYFYSVLFVIMAISYSL